VKRYTFYNLALWPKTKERVGLRDEKCGKYIEMLRVASFIIVEPGT